MLFEESFKLSALLEMEYNDNRHEVSWQASQCFPGCCIF